MSAFSRFLRLTTTIDDVHEGMQNTITEQEMDDYLLTERAMDEYILAEGLAGQAPVPRDTCALWEPVPMYRKPPGIVKLVKLDPRPPLHGDCKACKADPPPALQGDCKACKAGPPASFTRGL